jgi:hypothetical protein
VVNGQELVTFDGQCGREEFKNYTHYSNSRDFSEVTLNWIMQYNEPEDKPHPHQDLLKFNAGVVEVWATISLEASDGSPLLSTRTIRCTFPGNETHPYYIAECKNIKYEFKSGIKHMAVAKIMMTGKTGGYKDFRDRINNKVITQRYSGTAFAQPLHVIFDLIPPTHCSMDDSCEVEDVGFPIYVTPDISRDRVNIFWSSWDDTDSGIGQFYYSVYSMAPNELGELTEKEPPIHNGTWGEDETIWYTPPRPGTYSVVVTVSDTVGNVRKARMLFMYDGSSQVEVLPEHPVRVTSAYSDAEYRWMSPNVTKLEVEWTGRYINRDHVNPSMLGNVSNFVSGESDPNFVWLDMSDHPSANRTKKQIINVNGIHEFKVAYEKNPTNDQEPREDDWVTNYQNQTASIPVSGLADGDTVRVWVNALDYMNNSKIDYVTVNVDGSAPAYSETASSIIKNAPAAFPRPHFASIVKLRLVDQQSGIDEIEYEVHEVRDGAETTKLPGAEGVEKGQRPTVQRRRRRRRQTICDASSKCYCLKDKVTCYMMEQSVYLDNCWFLDKEAKYFVLKFRAYNKARLVTEGTKDIKQLEDLEGRGQFLPLPKSAFKIQGGVPGSYDVMLRWDYPKCCYQVKHVRLEFIDHTDTLTKLTVTGMSSNVSSLRPITQYTIKAIVVYEPDGRESEPISITFNTTAPYPGYAHPQTPGLGGGEIAGIVIGVLLVLLLLVLLIVVLVRKRQHKPAVPAPITQASQNVRNRVSTWFGSPKGGEVWGAPPPYDNPESASVSNPAYGRGGQDDIIQPSAIAYPEMGDDDDMYIYGDMETDAKARWKFSNDRIQIGKVLPGAKGSFAVIRLATITTKKGKETVVAKSLKPHHSDDDERLMRAKMNFMGTKLRFHANIVNFIGALPEADGGPVLLLDYCDEGRLSDWLAKHKKLDEEVEENIINFSMMIANGLQYLHENDIIHRRLGARNIFLKTKNGSLHAKLAGFGPMKGEAEGTEDAKEKIPVKWMAPEQMDKAPGQKRIYSKETDVWSYGIVLWELYSKGDQPYPGIKAKELKEQVKNGYRMPKPNDCPDHLYTEIMQECWYEKPGVRPPIEQIYMSLREYYDSAGRQSTYYDEDDLMEEEDLYYADGLSTMQYAKTH